MDENAAGACVEGLMTANALRTVEKETLVGSINGSIRGSSGGVAVAWFGGPVIGGIITAAMVVNFLFAGLAATFILSALNFWVGDPVVGSAVFLTTVTDVILFFRFWIGCLGIAMTGQPGILALWNDCAEAGETEYERWYMTQHLPERIGVPGFRFGRRYLRLEGDRKYFTFYETDTPDVLWSPEYMQRLGNPTDWTQRVMQDFRNHDKDGLSQGVIGGYRHGRSYGDVPDNRCSGTGCGARTAASGYHPDRAERT